MFLVQENKTVNLCDYYEKSNLVDPMSLDVISTK